MCGRYTLKAPRDTIAEAFDLADIPSFCPAITSLPLNPWPSFGRVQGGGRGSPCSAGASFRPGPTTPRLAIG